MSRFYKSIAIMSLIITFISFLLSWRNNVWFEAMLRAVVVFILCFVFISVFIWLIKYFFYLSEPVGSQDTQQIATEEVHQQHNAEEDSSQHIDLKTPQEDDQFKPWQPEKMKDNEP